MQLWWSLEEKLQLLVSTLEKQKDSELMSFGVTKKEQSEPLENGIKGRKDKKKGINEIENRVKLTKSKICCSKINKIHKTKT